MPASRPPPPAPDLESRFFWDGLRARRLLVQRCDSCGRHRFPPMPSCPYCGAADAAIVEIEPRGSVYSWVVVHRAFAEEHAPDVPYVVAVVDLEAGCRTIARLEDANGMVAGLPVHGHYVDHGEWTELRFRPAGGDMS